MTQYCAIRVFIAQQQRKQHRLVTSWTSCHFTNLEFQLVAQARPLSKEWPRGDSNIGSWSREVSALWIEPHQGGTTSLDMPQIVGSFGLVFFRSERPFKIQFLSLSQHVLISVFEIEIKTGHSREIKIRILTSSSRRHRIKWLRETRLYLGRPKRRKTSTYEHLPPALKPLISAVWGRFTCPAGMSLPEVIERRDVSNLVSAVKHKRTRSMQTCRYINFSSCVLACVRTHASTHEEKVIYPE